MKSFRGELNDALRSDEIKVFGAIEVSRGFNAKKFAYHREYSYFLPTFMLAR
jgi:tRNA U38,U39,U40 pseudouridine synthase TruA